MRLLKPKPVPRYAVFFRSDPRRTDVPWQRRHPVKSDICGRAKTHILNVYAHITFVSGKRRRLRVSFWRYRSIPRTPLFKCANRRALSAKAARRRWHRDRPYHQAGTLVRPSRRPSGKTSLVLSVLVERRSRLRLILFDLAERAA